jgi:hypothetical protein
VYHRNRMILRCLPSDKLASGCGCLRALDPKILIHNVFLRTLKGLVAATQALQEGATRPARPDRDWVSDTVEHHESQRSPASGLLPRAERMGWCAHLSIDELRAVGRDDIAVPGPVGARLRATESPRPSRRSPASGLLPRAERMVGVHVFRSMSFGLSAEMTLPCRDR